MDLHLLSCWWSSPLILYTLSGKRNLFRKPISKELELAQKK